MNYRRPHLLDELAAHYVLGTLRGPARRRFERVVERDGAALAIVQRWEDRLAGLMREISPVAPPELLWDRVRLRVRREERTRRAGAFAGWQGLRLALAASVAALAIAFGYWTWLGPGSSQVIATIADAQQGQLWIIEASRNQRELRVTAAPFIQLDAARAYELWALPSAEAAPVSLGLLPREGRGNLPLNDAQRAALERSRKVAISLEPLGGSPTGAPTGPVLYVAELQG